METKKGLSKIALVLIILIVLLIIVGGTVLTIWLIQKNSNKAPVEIELYEDYQEGQGFTADEESFGIEYTPLASELKEYRNDEFR